VLDNAAPGSNVPPAPGAIGESATGMLPGHHTSADFCGHPAAGGIFDFAVAAASGQIPLPG